MSYLEPCLVLGTDGQWRIEERPPIPARIPPQFDWSSELSKAARFYRKNGEDLDRRKRARAKLKSRVVE